MVEDEALAEELEGPGNHGRGHDIIDRDLDARVERTRNRPLVTGLIAPMHGLIFAVGLEIVAFAWLTAGGN